MKPPSFSQWIQLPKVLSKREKAIFITLIVLALSSIVFFGALLYINNTKISPDYSGSYAEGIVGQPRFINPVYSDTNDVDRTLVELIYSGLMTYDKNGELIFDLAENYQVSENGTAYTFELKDNLFWQDGIPLTSDDVLYTIKTIQNSEYKSPLRANWLDVDVQKTSDNTIVFLLNSPYNSFLENATVKIIPEHIWKNVLPQNFALSSYNLQPVGSGHYTISSIEQNSAGFIKNISLTANRKHHEKTPYISNLSFRFFENENEMLKAAGQRTIDGFSTVSFSGQDAENQIKSSWGQNEKFAFYSLSMPRYFAVFFNTEKSHILSDKNITKALSYAVNKQEFIQNLTSSSKGNVTEVNSPILPYYYGYQPPTIAYNFDIETAKNFLDKSGYTEQNLPGQEVQRAKENDKKLSFQFKSYLKISSKGNDVVELQGCLARLDEEFKTLLQNETSGTYGRGTGEAVEEFQKKYLPDLESTAELGPSTREKLNDICFEKTDNLLPLQFVLTTINQKQMIETANLLADYWGTVGAKVEVKTAELAELKDIIKNRDYDALLYGQALSNSPDLYPFWHSTQIHSPGLNLSYYQNKEADKLIKEARESLNQNVKKQNYEQLQDLILNDAPALFLYNPDYVYWVFDKIKGIDTLKIVDPAKRFANVENWYINTRRVWK